MPPKNSAGKRSAKDTTTVETDLLMEKQRRMQNLNDTSFKFTQSAIEIEEKNSRLNYIKIQNTWKEIMKSAKSASLKAELQSLQQIHSRRIDRKNHAIGQLQKYLEEAEEQYSTALQSHLINIDSLIDIHFGRLNRLQSQFEMDLGGLEVEFNEEKTKIQIQHLKDKTDIAGIIHRMDQEFQDAEADAKHEYQSQRDDVKNKLNISVRTWKKNMLLKFNSRAQLTSCGNSFNKYIFCNRFTKKKHEYGTTEFIQILLQALNNYNAATEERKKQFEELKLKDHNSANVIEQQMKKLSKLQETISSLKSKLSQISRDFEADTFNLRKEREQLSTQFRNLKKKMNNCRELKRKKLTELTVLSDRAVKELNEKVDLAERIIKLAEMNKKLESEREIVQPFGDVKQDEENEPERLPSPPSDILPPEFAPLAQFYRRYNNALLDKLAMESERSKLLEENQRLKAALKSYLEGISVNEDVLRKDNPLLVVNGKTNVRLHKPSTTKQITCVEAAHVAPRLLIRS
ncbi:hypothetical protein BKA69DRAFT_1037786 [Paraphysoderma sedebokerense]|nr:hypothetical protein BKA69DRAFT_1037786 [Paraphysoderma sedebokerense]